MDDHTIRLKLPLKYLEMIRVTFVPDFPGPIVSCLNLPTEQS